MTLLIYLNFLFCGCLTFIFFLPLSIGLPTRYSVFDNLTFPADQSLQFSSDSIVSFADSPVVEGVLIRESDFSGRLGVFFGTIDGFVGGHQISTSLLSKHENMFLRWSYTAVDERFVSSPITVTVDEQDQCLILLVSDRGSLFGFDQSGNLIVQIRIPDVLISLSETNWNRSLPLVDSSILGNLVHWDWGVNVSDLSGLHRLTPRVYTTPIALPTTEADVVRGDVIDSECVLIPVTFISSPSSLPTKEYTEGLVLAALLSISRRTLLSTHIWGSSTLRWRETSILLPLELDRSDKSSLPYLFSQPVLVSVPSSLESVNPWRPQFAVLISTFTGRLHRVSLPLQRHLKSGQIIWRSLSSGPVSFAHSCVMVDCPPVPLGTRSQSPRLCCLLVDTSSSLRLIITDFGTSSPTHVPDSLVWEYRPLVNASLCGMRQQLGHVALVPGSCSITPCGLWAVYPTADGLLHVVSVNSGTTVKGYPVQLFIPECDKKEGYRRTFTSGPGLLYHSSDSVPWMLFSDTTGRLYQVRINEEPIVLASDNGMVQSGVSSTTWIAPIAVALTRPSRPDSLGLLVTSASGITMLTPDNRSSLHFYRYPLFDAHFLDRHGEPTDIIHLDSDQQSIDYRIHNCPDQPSSENSQHVAYVARLLDSMGLPISTWSVPTRIKSLPTSSASDLGDCKGTLTFTPPVYGSFRRRVYLLVLNPHTGRVLSPPSRFSHQSDIVACSVVLDSHTSWPQLIVLWTYIPLGYFLLTFLILYSFSGTDYSPHSCVV